MLDASWQSDFFLLEIALALIPAVLLALPCVLLGADEDDWQAMNEEAQPEYASPAIEALVDSLRPASKAVQISPAWDGNLPR